MRKILYLMLPLIPHFASECLSELESDNEKKWPVVNNQFLTTNNINIVIQINGKKRSLINVLKDINEEEIIKQIKKNTNTKKYLDNKNIIRTIFIKNKLINLIIK